MDSTYEKGALSRIRPVLIEEELKTSFLDYAMSVIVSRAIPDVRDGLKPVHRRRIYIRCTSCLCTIIALSKIGTCGGGRAG